MSEEVQNISAGGYSLVFHGGRNILLSGDGSSYELTLAEVQAIKDVRAEDFENISAAYNRSLSELKTRKEILSLAVSSYNFIQHNEAAVREVDAVVQNFAASFFSFVRRNPKKAGHYISSLEDMIFAATRGEALKKGNAFGALGGWQKFVRCFRKNVDEDNIKKQAKIFWRNISLNQELYSDYICGGGVSFEGVVAASAANCRQKQDVLRIQKESMETARKQKDAAQKQAGILALQNLLAGRLYAARKPAAAAPAANVIDFPKAVQEIRRIVRIEDLVFMNA